MSFAPLPIRLFCDLEARALVFDLASEGAATFYRGDDIEIDIGIGQGGALLTSLGNVASVTCQLFAAENDTNPPMMAATVAAAQMNLALTQLQWTQNTTPFCHAAFVFANAVTAISLGGADSQNYWLRITALTSDSPPKTITLLDGPILVKDGPISAVSSVPPAYFRLYTVGGNVVPQIYDPVSAHYYNLEIDTVGGVRTLSLGDTAY